MYTWVHCTLYVRYGLKEEYESIPARSTGFSTQLFLERFRPMVVVVVVMMVVVLLI